VPPAGPDQPETFVSATVAKSGSADAAGTIVRDSAKAAVIPSACFTGPPGLRTCTARLYVPVPATWPERKQELATRTSHLVSPLAAQAWRAREVLCNTESMRATFFEFFYGTRTPAPVVVQR